MFRNRVRPPTPPLDDLTAERLLRGAPVEDIPDAYRPLARLLAEASAPPSPGELEGSAAAAAAFVAAHHVANAPRRRRRSLAASTLVAVTLAASTGTAIAATQGALPQPMQQVAHDALGTVGISVPGIERSRDDSGTDPSGAVTPTAGATVSGATPTTSRAGALTSPVPSTSSVGGSESATDIEHSNGEGTGPTNPNAGEGNNNAGGSGNGSGSGSGNPEGTPTAGGPDTPVNNLPSQSNGKGNGPPEVPPGQAKN